MRRTTLLLLICFLAGWAQAPTSWTPELSMQVASVGSVSPSPDGRLVAYTETRAVMATEKSEMVSQVFLAAADGSRSLQLTRGEKGATAPSFSPDGRYVYFLSDRSGKQNIWRIPVDGGEGEMLTDWKGSIGHYEVSPDGKWVAFAGVKPSEEEEKAAKEKRDYRVVDENPKSHSLWIIPTEAKDGKRGDARRLFDAPYHVVAFDWSPDSRRIAFQHQPTPSADDWTKADISEVEVESGKVKVMASTGAAESAPMYSPDGRYLAYSVTSDPPRWAGDAFIALVPVQGGKPRMLAPTYDERPTPLGWAGDSKGVYVTEPKNTRSAIYLIPLEGEPKVVYELDKGVLGTGISLNRAGTNVGFSYETASEPPEAFVMALPGGRPIKVSRANLDLPRLPLGETKPIRWKSKDGLEIEGLLTYPAGYEAGKKYPLILYIHGGPTGVFGEAFIGRGGLYPLATFAAKGYAILRCNIRGSGGYGKKFRWANLNDWGGMDYEDLMAGVDHVVEMGVADPDRLAVMGWSYGGYMTSWVIGHTRRFKAAVVGAGVTNLWSFTGTSDITGFLPDYFSGEPWQNFDAFRNHSPMSYVKGVTTPTLILHGEADVRVPTSQGYELYNALKRQGITTQMVVYPRTPHGPQEPKFQLNIMHRHLDWVEKYVK